MPDIPKRDSRIKYCNGSKAGDMSGSISTSITYKGKQIRKHISWSYPNKLEIAAINEMKDFLRDYS